MGRNLKKIFARLLQILVSVWLLFSVTFLLLQIFPGSPFHDEVSLHPMVQERLQSQYGLGASLSERYLRFLKASVSGDLGMSWQEPNVTVRTVLQQKAGLSFYLGASAFFVAFVMAFLFSVIFMRSPFLDGLTLVMISVPSLLIGPFLIWFFGFYFDLLPVALLESPKHWILPIVVLMLRPLFQLTRVLKISLQKSERSPFAQTGRALGQTDLRLRWRWILKASLTPFLSQASLILVSLISGSFLVESLFAIPGLGAQFVDSVLNRDYPMVLGLAVFYGTILMVVQMILDLILTWTDPRVETL